MVALNKAHKETHTPSLLAQHSGLRFYSAEISRWLSRDPIGEEGGLNVYGFVGNEPPRNWDLLGLADATSGNGSAAEVDRCCVWPPLELKTTGALLGNKNLQEYKVYPLVGGNWNKTQLGPCAKGYAVEMIAIHDGQESCTAKQEFKVVQGNAATLKSVGKALQNIGAQQGTDAAELNKVYQEASLGTAWVEKFATINGNKYISLGDLPSLPKNGAKGVIDFRTCFVSKDPPKKCCKWAECCIDWTWTFNLLKKTTDPAYVNSVSLKKRECLSTATGEWVDVGGN